MKHCFPEHLTSARLRLRRFRRDDAEALCAYRSVPEVARYQSWDSFGPDDAARLIDSQLTAEPDIPGTWFQLAIVETATGDVIGDCGLHCPKEDSRQTEIGITLAPRHQGHRYAAEAVECLLDYLFGSLNKHRVFATTDVLNSPAVALFQRSGFRQEAHLVEHLWFKGQWGSEYVFAMLRREWEERHGQPAATPNNKSDAGNGSNGICRVIDACREMRTRPNGAALALPVAHDEGWNVSGGWRGWSGEARHD